MTKEELQKWLKNLKSDVGNSQELWHYEQAIDRVIEALSDKDINVSSNDCISRQSAIDAMCDACSDWCDEGVCKKVSAIQQLPSAQPEIIRCKNCRFFYERWCHLWEGDSFDEAFCSYAERRTDE